MTFAVDLGVFGCVLVVIDAVSGLPLGTPDVVTTRLQAEMIWPHAPAVKAVLTTRTGEVLVVTDMPDCHVAGNRPNDDEIGVSVRATLPVHPKVGEVAVAVPVNGFSPQPTSTRGVHFRPEELLHAHGARICHRQREHRVPSFALPVVVRRAQAQRPHRLPTSLDHAYSLRHVGRI
jgi:hypothetical protein